MRSAGGRRKARATAKPPRSAAKVDRQLAELTAEIRLRTAERDQALAQQTATAEVLQVINSSAGDLAPVFDAILDKAMHLCGAAFGALGTWQGERFAMLAMRGGERLAHYLATNETSLGPRGGFARVAKSDGYVQFTDISQSKFYRSGDPHTCALVDLGGARSTLTVPLAREDEVLGLLLFYRQEVRPFSEQEIALVKSFAAQAVIAMENARLLEAINGRNRDLEQSLERQTATSDILGAIAASPGEAEGTLRKIAETTARLFSAAGVSIRLVEGDEFKLSVGVGRGAKQVSALYEDPATRPTPRGRNLPAAVVGENRQIQIRDLDNLDPEMTDWPGPPVARAAGIRTMVGTPLRSGGHAIGAMTVYREELRPFDDVELQLLQSFADQAVIAIENTRLLTDQREALERQTATADVLQVINSSPGQLTPIFEAMLERATRLCEARFGVLWLYEGERFRAGAVHAVPAAFSEFCREPVTVGAGASLVEIVRGDSFVHVADLAVTELYKAGHPLRRAVVDLGGARTLLSVPLRKDDTLLGAFTIYRQEVKPFSDKQIALVQNFAAQAVIAMENARLLGELRQRTGDLEESLEYQTATSDVLKVISRSTFDLQPVLDILAETAGRLCQADYAAIFRRDGDVYRIATAVGYSPEMTEDAQRYQAYLEQHPLVPGRGSVTGRVALEGHAVHVVDTASDPEYVLPATKLGKLRTQLGVPMLREGSPIGVIVLGRQRVEAFSQRQIKLVTTFADQAIIAIENARLLSEQHDALERQTATAEVLQVINSSPGDLAPVFEAILEKAHKLCAVSHGSLQLCDGETFRAVAVHGLSEAFADRLRQGYIPGPNVPSRRVIEGARFAHVADLGEIDDPVARAAAELSGIRTTLFIPLRKDGVLLGQIVAARQEVRPFTEKEIALLESFAAQAVIAMENARLITETREALEQQTATAEVLQVINSSPGALAPVFDAVLEKATRLCDFAFSILWTYDGEAFHAVAMHGVPESYAAHLAGHAIVPPPNTEGAFWQFIAGRDFIHFDDVAVTPLEQLTPRARGAVEIGGARTNMLVALRKEGRLLGAIEAYRTEVRPFSEKQVSLLQSFAAQAVIAMENARLITETREALEQQTATAEVLQVINASPGDLTPVFNAMLEKAMRLCEAAFGGLWTFDGDRFVITALRGVPMAYAEYLRGATQLPGPGTAPYRFFVGGERSIIQNTDLAAEEPYRAGDPQRRALVDLGGARTALQVPLIKDDAVLGLITIYRQEVRPFSDKQIALLQNFAAQAVIAMENARLITETREALKQQTATTEVLQVINASPGDLAPVFHAILEKAHSLCAVDHGSLQLYDGEKFRVVAAHGLYGALPEWMREAYRPGPNHPLQQLLEGARFAHVSDWAEIDDPRARALAESGLRTTLFIPLRKDNVLLGHIGASRGRSEVRPFAEKEIALLENFAAQAVIAMENARLITETREALEQQSATAEILRVINTSPGKLEPVFDAILEQAHRLCDVTRGVLGTYDGSHLRAVTTHGIPEPLAGLLRQPFQPLPNSPHGRLVSEKRVIHVSDIAAESEWEWDDPKRTGALAMGVHTMMFVPLLKEDVLLGYFSANRREVRPFSDKEIKLLESFAAHAVIAMENARLITETREALEQQTATAEVLQVINSSPGDLAPVFEAMLEKATLVCSADAGVLTTWDGERFWPMTWRGFRDFPRDPIRPHPELGIGRVARGEDIVHILDSATGEVYRSGDPARRAIVELGGARTQLTAALRKEGKLLGSFTLWRREVQPFTDKQIALLQNFAAQAVIAMENARLITETREALEQQTATAEILQVINSSPGELAPVFDAILEKGHRLCSVAYGSLQTYDGDWFRAVAVHDLPEQFADLLRRGFSGSDHPVGRALLAGERLVHLTDCAEIDHPVMQSAVELAGIRTALFVPLRRDEALLGMIVSARREVKPFTEKEIALLESFAAQAVIAMENARLLNEIRHRNAALAEALEFQTATGEVLRIVASSPDNLQSVFDAMLEKATALCEAKFGTLFLYDGKGFTVAADRNLPPAYAEVVRSQSFAPETNLGFRRLVENKAPVHVKDVFADAAYDEREPLRVAAIELGSVRSFVAVPMLKKGELIGNFSIYRDEPGGFAENQVALVTTFADQAVIAIENARLFGELRERQAELARSVDELTATGDVLKIISRSSVELETVLDTLVETVARLCRADQANMFRQRDDKYHLVACHGLSAEAKEFLLRNPLSADRGTLSGRVQLEHRVVHIPDVLADSEYTYRDGQKIQGHRTMLGIPLLRGDALIGIFAINRTRVEPYTSKEIELATTFADQAVIAIENARLFEELRDRQAELARSVDELTATGDVLKIISRSSVDLETVLDTLVETVARLCHADLSYMFRRRDDKYHLVTAYGLSAEQKEFIYTHPFAADRGSLSGRVELERRPVHIPDVLADPDYTYPGQRAIGYRTLLGIPLLRQDTLLGVFVVSRMHVEPFSDKEIELATTFADQAVIAIENARLFEELRERQAELRVTFDNMGDGVAMFDADRRLAAWNRNLQEMLELPHTFLAQRPSYAELFRYLAERGEFGSVDLKEELRRNLEDTIRAIRYERTRPDGRVIEVRRNPVPGGGFVLIYADITERKRAEEAIHTARDAAETALRELQTAQASLLHSQKMAALGQLTAGIAHEIKNPLNFVNNFAGLSNELLTELKEVTAPTMARLDLAKRAELDETFEMLTGNLNKIIEHGRRADGIVRSMLAHSRGGSGDWQAADLNALVEEALNLAYHGARAQDQSFNITMERDLDRNLEPVEVVPQDVTRVFLNLIGNGFYAANKRKRDADAAFRPVLQVATRDLGDTVEIRVRDNGIGIAREHRERLFQPFFTTKPTGEGTGLGLSISYDIITQQHGGAISVDSEVGSFTEFTVRLPRRRHVATAGRSA